MQRYWWPGYQMQLLGALQRQQNNAQFCDTLLQTEGISVPTHRCILAALSPYLSEKLLNSPSPQSGHKRQLQIQAVNPHTLLKLVGLLYSGEVEVKGSVEQNDVLSAACQFGITGLVERLKDGGMKEVEPLRDSCGSCRGGGEGGKMQDAQVQAEMAGRGAPDCPIGKRSCVSTGTQTDEKTTGTSLSHSSQTNHPTREPETPVEEEINLFIAMQPQNLSPDERSYSTSVPSGALSNEETTLNQPSCSATNSTSTSAWPSDELISLNDDSDSMTAQEDGSHQQSPVFGDRIGTGLEDDRTNAEKTDERENTEQPSHTSRDEELREEGGISAERKRTRTRVGMKSLAKMTQMHQLGTTKISIKLKRRTKGEVWEVVSIQDGDEPRSVLTSLKQTDLTNSDPSSVQSSPVHIPKTPVVDPVGANSPEAPPLPNPTSDSQPVCSEIFISNQNYELESVSLARSPGPVEESDEDLEKLLEDIMIGLNILPNLERDCKEPHHPQASPDGALAICQIPGTENERAPGQTPAACVNYQDYRTQNDHSSTDTAPNQPSISSLSPEQSNAVLVHQLQQVSTATSMGERDGTSHQDVPLPKSQDQTFPEAPTGSVVPTAFHSSGQTQHYPACQGPSSHDNQDILDFLPLTDGNEVQTSHSLSAPPHMDDLRLAPCLSPLQQCASVVKDQPPFNNDPLRPSHVPSWLTGNSISLQYPLCAVIDGESLSLPLETNQNSSSEQQQEFKSPQDKGTRAESPTVTEVEEGGTKSAGRQNATEVKESLTFQQSDTKGDTVAPKRRKRKRVRCHPQDASYDLEDTYGTKTQIRLNICSVSLSSNNVLSKSREMASTSSNTPSHILGGPDELSAITQSSRETTRGTGDSNDGQTLIRTRGFLKKNPHTPGNASLENSSVLKPMAHQTKIVNEQGVTLAKRKRGRPPKVKREVRPLAVSEKKSPSVESEQEHGNNLSKEDEKTTRRCKKRRTNGSEVVVIPPKKPMNADMVERDDRKDIIPRVRNPGTRPQMVSLKEFQKLIKRQHSKTMKSKEKQDNKPNAPAKDAGSEERACESVMEPEVDINPPQKSASHAVFNATVDENHNLVFSKSSAECSKSQGDDTEKGSAGEEKDPPFSSDALREEAEVAAEREQPLKNLNGGVTDTTPPQENKKPLEHKFNSLTLEGSGPPLPEAAGLIKSPGCYQEEEETDNKVVDVDTRLYSPENVYRSREEEDEDDIDVVGD